MTSHEHFDALFSDLTLGNTEAANFCQAFFRWVHCLDDLVDRDKDVPAGHVAFMAYSLIHTVACNEFFQKHRTELLATILMASQAWADSEEWKKRPDVLHRLTSQVLKSQYQDVFLHVAALCGGIFHMQKMAIKYRDYNFDQH